MIIYKATNLVNGKVYIGQTINDLSVRKSAHKSEAMQKHRDYPFQRAIRKYGFENFRWDIIAVAKSGKELNELEIAYIKKYKSRNSKYGYNVEYGGGNSKHPPSVRRKISKANKGRKLTDEQRKNVSEARKGRTLSIGHRLAISAAGKGRVFTEEHRRNMGMAELGSKNHQAKLTEEDVIEIKRRIFDGEANTAIAKDYPVSHKMISLIRCGKAWRHIDGP